MEFDTIHEIGKVTIDPKEYLFKNSMEYWRSIMDNWSEKDMLPPNIDLDYFGAKSSKSSVNLMGLCQIDTLLEQKMSCLKNGTVSLIGDSNRGQWYYPLFPGDTGSCLVSKEKFVLGMVNGYFGKRKIDRYDLICQATSQMPFYGATFDKIQQILGYEVENSDHLWERVYEPGFMRGLRYQSDDELQVSPTLEKAENLMFVMKYDEDMK